MGKDKIKVYFDGIIFEKNPTGGIARVFSNMIRNMLERTDVIPLVYIPEGTELEWLPAGNTVFYGKPARLRPSRLFKGINEKITARATRRRWGGLAGGIFISTFYTTYPALRIPQLLFVHDMIFEKYPQFFGTERYERHRRDKENSIKAANAIACCSESTKKDLCERFNTEQKVLRVIPYGISKDFHPPSDEIGLKEIKDKYTNGCKYIIHVGARRYRHKNFKGFLKAYSEWDRKGKVHVLSVGGGEFDESEEQLISALALDGLIHCVPCASNAELITLYNGATACVVPSFCEGFGFPLLEAMACGLPVLASDRTSLPEIGGNIPEYFAPDDTGSILRALTVLVELENNTARLESGIIRAGEYTWDNTVDCYTALMREMLNSWTNE